jgi:hypothetical protein
VPPHGLVEAFDRAMDQVRDERNESQE